jgi:hypothetical protein
MTTKSFRPDVDVAEWTGAQRPYDIIKEGVIAFLVVVLLTISLAVIFGSPDEHPVTLRQWSRSSAVDFVQTAESELAGTSGSAAYGTPYNHVAGTGQQIGPVALGNIVGVRIPVAPARDFILAPLATQPDGTVPVSALHAWHAASSAEQQSWLDAWAKATVTVSPSGDLQVNATAVGPLPTLLQSLLRMARSGALDQALLSGGSQYFATDYTKPLLFLADGTYFASLADAQHLKGDQWGMMNETGNYPGQAWLWLYTFWYQVAPFSSSGNADALVWGLMMLLSACFVFLPFIPGLRSVPRRLKLYRLVWRAHYRNQ